MMDTPDKISVKELYDFLDGEIPSSLSAPWDNDGIMCIPEPERTVKKILLTLDVTEKAVHYADINSFDIIISHHPMIFHPVSHIFAGDSQSDKIITLIKKGISVISFHTRLDALDGGVNDRLSAILGIDTDGKFGETPDDNITIGRVGNIFAPCDIDSFVRAVKEKLGCSHVNYVKATDIVHRVALVGGDGKDFVRSAKAVGADTYITGSISYNAMCDALEAGINVIEAGHFFTENPVLDSFSDLICKKVNVNNSDHTSENPNKIKIEKFYSNPVITL